MNTNETLKQLIAALILESKNRELENELHEKEVLDELFEELFNK